MATVPHRPETLQTVQIAIMAKAPMPGLAKTRLIPVPAQLEPLDALLAQPAP